MVTNPDEQYVYDADDERIASIHGRVTTYTVRGADQKVLGEVTDTLTPSGTYTRSWQRDYVYRDDL